MNAEEVLKLAKLARIEVPAEEAESLSHEFDAILGYVGQVKEVSVSITKESPWGLKNIMRDDTNPHESGIYTDSILENAPAKENGYIKVKKIL